MQSTPSPSPKQRNWFTQIIAPILIVIAIGAAIGGAGLGVYQLSGAPSLVSSSSSSSASSSVGVSIPIGVGNSQALNFQPSSVTVAKGGTVTWTNNDPVLHTVTSTSVPAGATTFDSGAMNSTGTTATFKVTFTVDGTYNYTCSYHPWMHGTVIVTG